MMVQGHVALHTRPSKFIRSGGPVVEVKRLHMCCAVVIYPKSKEVRAS